MAYISFQPSDYFNTKLYTGNGSTNAITGVGFQPDWVWVKNRTDASTNHLVTDAVRGATKCLFPNLTNAEVTEANALQSFNSDGFTLGSDSSVNTNTKNWVSWNWRANGQGSSNTDGTINTTYTSANTTSGFSIVKWTGTGANGTVGHGLGVAPSLIITKSLASTQEWCVGSDALGWGNYLFLNETSASQSGSTYWQSTAPTNQVFSVGTAGPTNSSSGDLIAYCFAEKTGFSKFGSYIGNGSTWGTFVNCGFKPAFLMLKKTSGTGDWFINDIKRNTFNVVNSQLYPNLNAAEEDTNATQLDILSNGFKLRGTTSNALNSGSDTYIFMAFAEAPLVSSNGVPAVAR